MFRKVFVQILRSDELEYCVPQKFQPLIGTQSEICVSDTAVRESPGQKPNVVKLDADRVFKLGELLQQFEFLDPLAISSRFLCLQRMRRQIHPDFIKVGILFEECVAKHPIYYLCNIKKIMRFY